MGRGRSRCGYFRNVVERLLPRRLGKPAPDGVAGARALSRALTTIQRGVLPGAVDRDGAGAFRALAAGACFDMNMAITETYGAGILTL